MCGFLGRELHWGCWFKETFGIPCPTCGVTRSVILTLHGRVGQAIALNIGGPALVAGCMIFGVLMFYQASDIKNHRVGRKIALTMAIYGWASAFLIMSQWALRITIWPT